MDLFKWKFPPNPRICRTRPPKLGNEEYCIDCGYKSLVRRKKCMHVGCKTPSPCLLCQPILEEPESVEFEEFKRQHRHRPPRNRYLNQSILKYFSYSFTSMSLRAEFNARVRGTSHIDFKTATTGVAAKSMRNELSRLVSTIDDPVAKKVPFSQYVLCSL